MGASLQRWVAAHFPASWTRGFSDVDLALLGGALLAAALLFVALVPPGLVMSRGVAFVTQKEPDAG